MKTPRTSPGVGLAIVLTVAGLFVASAPRAAWAQTNPPPRSLPYTQDFSALNWADPGYPIGWQGWTLPGPAGPSFNANPPVGDQSLRPNTDASYPGGGVHNVNGKIGLLADYGADMGLCLAIDCSGRSNITVGYDVMTIRNPYDGAGNTRIDEVTLQYRIGTGGPFTSLTGVEYQNNTTMQTSGTTPQNPQARSLTLPPPCDYQSYVQLRWVSRTVSGSGQFPSFAVDNISVGYASVPTVDGFISPGEYGVHTDGQNQQTSGSQTWYMTWDDNSLYVGLANANTSEGAVLYLDKSPVTPVNDGADADGSIVGSPYDNTNFAALQFRADLVVYFKDGYRELRLASAGGWSGPLTFFGTYASSGGNTREIAIPWSFIGGRPASFDWFGYATSGGGFVYGPVPLENGGGPVGMSARWERYYTVSNGTPAIGTRPFSRNSFVFNSLSDESGFGPITVYDFTMNSLGRTITRGGGPWTIGGSFRVDAGGVDFGGTPQPATVAGDITIGGPGWLRLSSSLGGDLILNGNYTANGPVQPNERTVSFDGSSEQLISGSGVSMFSYLTINNPAGVRLNSHIDVARTLTLGANKLRAGPWDVNMESGSSVSRSTGYVTGNLVRMSNAGSNVTLTYDIGDSLNYSPVSLFVSSVPGFIAIRASTVGYEHPNIGSSAINPAKSANRYWALRQYSGSVPSLDATFNFVPGDVDPGASPNSFIAGQYESSAWTYPAVSGRTPTSLTVTGVSSPLSAGKDFALGETSCPSITLSPTSLPYGVQWAPYNQTITASGGTGPYTFAVTLGGLPPGLNLSSAGALSGAPSSTGTWNFTVTATDSHGCAGSQPYALDITTCPPITLSPPTLPDAAQGAPYSQTVTAGGGMAPYLFTVGSGSLPPGFSLSPGGTISGTCTTAGNYSFVVKVSDAYGCYGSRDYSIAVVAVVYTWIDVSPRDWQNTSNWTPARTTPTPYDVIQFSGTMSPVNNVPTQTVAQLLLSGGAVTELRAAGTNTLTISGGAGTDLSVPAGCVLNASGPSPLTISLGPGATGSIGGSMSLRESPHRLTASDAGAMVFGNGSVVTQDFGCTGNIFTSSGTPDVAVFSSGSVFRSGAGSDPFALPTPESKVVFQAGSTYRYEQSSGLGLSFSGRTYGNFEMTAPGAIANPSGGDPCSIDNLTVTMGSLRLGLSGPVSVRGNVTVSAGQTLAFDGTGTATLNGATAQTIGGGGALTFGPSQTLEIGNPAGVTLWMDLPVSRLKLTAGNITTGPYKVAIADGGTVTRTSGHVIGDLQKRISAGAAAPSFEIGDATRFTPVDLAFSNVTVPGDLIARTTTAEHPQIGSSNINSAKSVNRYWTFTNSGIVFDSCSAKLNFDPGDVDGGADPARLIVGRYAGGWSYPRPGLRAPTYTQALGITTFSDFAIGEPSTYTITASVGLHGSISPSGAVTVSPGDTPTFTITADPGYEVLDVKVDGGSVGAVTTYVFPPVNADHTIHADFVVESNVAPVLAAIGNRTVDELSLLTFTATATDANTPPQTLTFSLDPGAPAGASIHPVTGVFNWTPMEEQGPGDHPVTVRVTDNGTPPLDDSEAITVHVNEVNAAPVLSGVPATASIPELVAYGFTATATDADVPAQTLSFSLVGGPVGAAIDPGTGVFSWTPTEAQGPGVYAFSVRVSDGVTNTDAGITITVDEVSIPAIADLAVTQVKSGNDADGTTGVLLSWTATGSGTTVEVFRASFGSYPEYDDAVGLVPAIPSYPPAAPWALTGVTAPAGTDEVAGRDVYYYVAFVHGTGANVSAASNRSAGTLNYHLGDVTNGATPGTGDNLVNSADVSELGAHYGLTDAAVAPFNYLDVGPTLDYSVDTRPTTDNAIDFEDLVMFAMNYNAVGAPQANLREVVLADVDELVLEAPNQVGVGETARVNLVFRGTGKVQGLSARLSWDAAVVEPVNMVAGDPIGQQGGIVMSAAPGQVDAAILGLRGRGFAGEGRMATVSFRTLTAGDPKIHVASVDGRDAKNHKVAIGTSERATAPAIPTVTRLAGAMPNPCRENATIAFSLSRGGAVDLAIFSVDGRRVRTLARDTREPGQYCMTWDGRDDYGSPMAAGVYYAHLATAQGRFTKTLVYLR